MGPMIIPILRIRMWSLSTHLQRGNFKVQNQMVCILLMMAWFRYSHKKKCSRDSVKQNLLSSKVPHSRQRKHHSEPDGDVLKQSEAERTGLRGKPRQYLFWISRRARLAQWEAKGWLVLRNPGGLWAMGIASTCLALGPGKKMVSSSA